MLNPRNKIKTHNELITELINRVDNKIVFTNGCFDILHYGHFNLLLDAKSFGDILIVAINSDNSVKRLKGNSRPINNQEIRSFNLSCIECVDYVVIFDDNTPFELLSKLNFHGLILVDLLVKGGDYRIDEIVGHDIIRETKVVPFVDGHSTSKIIDVLKL